MNYCNGRKFIGNLLCVCGLLVAASCGKIEIVPPCGEQCVCDALNGNISFLAAVAVAFENEEELVANRTKYSPWQGDIHTVMFASGEVESYSHICEKKDSLPLVSMTRVDGELCWTLNGKCLYDSVGNMAVILGSMARPRFDLTDSGLVVSYGGREWTASDTDTIKFNRQRVYFNSGREFMICCMNDSLQLVVPTENFRLMLPRGVPLQGFYKDVFMDAGVYLTTRNTLAAATYLGYSLESVSCSNVADTAWQNTVIGGSAEDLNGRLLYPDGAPRYRMLFVCGGNSRTHGRSLRPECRDNMRTFVSNGGSYVGTCAGAFFASTGYDTIPNYPYYLAVWPGVMKHSGLVGGSTGLFVDPESPLLNYYDFGGDNYVANVRHNKGGYAFNWPTGTELLARYDNPDIPTMHGQPAAWAYKASVETGRVIMEGSHPEEVGSGERRDFTAAMLRYAVDGVGETKIKGLLRNGEVRMMDKTTNDGNPEHTMIGDMQYHHFAVYIPQGAHDIRLRVASGVDCNLQLSLKKGNYAYVDGTEYQSVGSGSEQELLFDSLSGGLWYVAVQCLTTVTATNVTLGQEYGGRTDVLNGVPYTINVTWK